MGEKTKVFFKLNIVLIRSNPAKINYLNFVYKCCKNTLLSVLSFKMP